MASIIESSSHVRRGTNCFAEWRRTVATLVVAGAALLALPAALARDSEDDWLATWGAGPQSAAEALIGPPPMTVQFDDQTIRMIARISKGGNRVRVRLDNTFGTDTLVIGSAHIAKHSSGAGIVGPTDNVLTFGGSPAITIPPGAPALSDPVDLKVPDLGEVAVSIYLPDPTAGVCLIRPLGRVCIRSDVRRHTPPRLATLPERWHFRRQRPQKYASSFPGLKCRQTIRPGPS